MASVESEPLARLLLANESRLPVGLGEVAAAGDFFEFGVCLMMFSLRN